MGKRTSKPPVTPITGFRLGRSGFAKISAVEGIALTQEMKRDFENFDVNGLSADERRRAIIGKYGKPDA